MCLRNALAKLCFLWERQYVKDLRTSLVYDRTTRKKTGTRSIPKVKPCRARIVPGWLTAWKYLLLLVFSFFYYMMK